MRSSLVWPRVVLPCLALTAVLVLYEEFRGTAATRSARSAVATTPQCHVTADVSAPLVCSHKGYHKAYNAPRGHHLFPPLQGNGLVRSVTWLVSRMGVKCFDLDLTLTQDGEVIVGHPKDLTKLLKLASPPSEHTLEVLKKRERLLSSNTSPDRATVVTLASFLEAAAALRLVQLSLEPKNFPLEKLKETAQLLGKYRESFKGHGAGLLLIVDEKAVDSAVRAELVEHVHLAVGVREASFGGDEALYCGGKEHVPDHVTYVMPSLEVVASCPDTAPGYRDGAAVWNVKEPSDVNHLARKPAAIITDYPAVIAQHCGDVTWGA